MLLAHQLLFNQSSSMNLQVVGTALGYQSLRCLGAMRSLGLRTSLARAGKC